MNTNGPDPKEVPDVDEPQTPDFHEVPEHLFPGTDNDVFAFAFQQNHVVGHQAVAPFHQVQSDFAFADAAAAGEKQPGAVDIHQSAVHAGTGCKSILQESDRMVGQSGGIQFRAENTDILLVRQFHHFRKAPMTIGDDETGDIQAHDACENGASLGLGKC